MSKRLIPEIKVPDIDDAFEFFFSSDVDPVAVDVEEETGPVANEQTDEKNETRAGQSCEDDPPSRLT